MQFFLVFPRWPPSDSHLFIQSVENKQPWCRLRVALTCDEGGRSGFEDEVSLTRSEEEEGSHMSAGGAQHGSLAQTNLTNGPQTHSQPFSAAPPPSTGSFIALPSHSFGSVYHETHTCTHRERERERKRERESTQTTLARSENHVISFNVPGQRRRAALISRAVLVYGR